MTFQELNIIKPILNALKSKDLDVMASIMFNNRELSSQSFTHYYYNADGDMYLESNIRDNIHNYLYSYNKINNELNNNGDAGTALNIFSISLIHAFDQIGYKFEEGNTIVADSQALELADSQLSELSLYLISYDGDSEILESGDYIYPEQLAEFNGIVEMFKSYRINGKIYSFIKNDNDRIIDSLLSNDELQVLNLARNYMEVNSLINEYDDIKDSENEIDRLMFLQRFRQLNQIFDILVIAPGKQIVLDPTRLEEIKQSPFNNFSTSFYNWHYNGTGPIPEILNTIRYQTVIDAQSYAADYENLFLSAKYEYHLMTAEELRSVLITDNLLHIE
ncbi:unnamed protein product [marine sediment metagenome]|uniref:Uncharacterized protein n=1 Tax=marine sediment metagenome TaxID=412755 RepID=X0YEV8_9ZZZZ